MLGGGAKPIGGGGALAPQAPMVATALSRTGTNLQPRRMASMY